VIVERVQGALTNEAADGLARIGLSTSRVEVLHGCVSKKTTLF
jgi:hypothetical protein